MFLTHLNYYNVSLPASVNARVTSVSSKHIATAIGIPSDNTCLCNSLSVIVPRAPGWLHTKPQ